MRLRQLLKLIAVHAMSSPGGCGLNLCMRAHRLGMRLEFDRSVRCLWIELGGGVLPGDVPAICRRVQRRMARDSPSSAVCDTGGALADATTLHLLALLALTAQRHRCRLRMKNVSAELGALVELAGLEEVLLS